MDYMREGQWGGVSRVIGIKSPILAKIARAIAGNFEKVGVWKKC